MTPVRNILKWADGVFREVADEVIGETPLTLFVNGREFVTLMTLGEHLDELAVGFLRSEGFLSRREQLKGLKIEDGRAMVLADVDLDLLMKIAEKRTVTTGCGKGTVFSGPLEGLTLRPAPEGGYFPPEALVERMRDLEGRSELYKRTGGVHNAALAAPEGVIIMRSDIGRHNAVDMLGGRIFLDGMDAGRLGLFVSGRISSEILRKTAAMGVPILVSRSAPTTLALDMADRLGLTVAGYARAGRFNLYTHPERITGKGVT